MSVRCHEKRLELHREAQDAVDLCSGWFAMVDLVGGLEHDWIMTFHILGILSSQLTFTPSFFRGVGLNHQPGVSFNIFNGGTSKWVVCFMEHLI